MSTGVLANTATGSATKGYTSRNTAFHPLWSAIDCVRVLSARKPGANTSKAAINKTGKRRLNRCSFMTAMSNLESRRVYSVCFRLVVAQTCELKRWFKVCAGPSRHRYLVSRVGERNSQTGASAGQRVQRTSLSSLARDSFVHATGHPKGGCSCLSECSRPRAQRSPVAV